MTIILLDCCREFLDRKQFPEGKDSEIFGSDQKGICIVKYACDRGQKALSINSQELSKETLSFIDIIKNNPNIQIRKLVNKLRYCEMRGMPRDAWDNWIVFNSTETPKQETQKIVVQEPPKKDLKIDDKNGNFKKVLDNGDTYEGDWVNGVPHGQGEYVWKNGNSYEGQFQLGKCHGRGKKVLVDKKGEFVSFQEGYFENGELNGEGFFNDAEGNEYNGQWKNGKKEGYGEFTFSNGSSYTGQWKSDKYHGKGIFKESDPDSYYDG